MTLDEAIRQHIKDRRKPKRKKKLSNVEKIRKIDQERLRAATYDDDDQPF